MILKTISLDSLLGLSSIQSAVVTDDGCSESWRNMQRLKSRSVLWHICCTQLASALNTHMLLLLTTPDILSSKFSKGYMSQNKHIYQYIKCSLCSATFFSGSHPNLASGVLTSQEWSRATRGLRCCRRWGVQEPHKPTQPTSLTNYLQTIPVQSVMRCERRKAPECRER